jgi:hypothetical protein
MSADDPTAEPASCRQAEGTLPEVQAKIDQAASTAATTALRKDFSESTRATLFWEVGIFALAGLLVFHFPRISKEDLERVATGG